MTTPRHRPRDLQRDHPRSRSSRRSRTRARSTCNKFDAPAGPPRSWTAWSATRSARCCGRRCSAGLSAGRVQSVAVRLIVEREDEIKAFNPVEYWRVDVRLTAEGPDAAVPSHGSSRSRRQAGRIAGQEGLELGARGRGRDAVDGAPGRPRTAWPRSSARSSASARRAAVHDLDAAAGGRAQAGLLGQADDGARAAALRGRRARGEGPVGLITYMRTDSVTIADTALREIARAREGRVRRGVPLAEPRRYKTKKRSAQDAHEAIRPTSAMRTPQRVGERARPRPAPALHADLAALRRVPDGRGALRPDERRHRGGRRRHAGTGCAPPAR